MKCENIYECFLSSLNEKHFCSTHHRAQQLNINIVIENLDHRMEVCDRGRGAQWIFSRKDGLKSITFD